MYTPAGLVCCPDMAINYVGTEPAAFDRVKEVVWPFISDYSRSNWMQLCGLYFLYTIGCTAVPVMTKKDIFLYLHLNIPVLTKYCSN